MASLLSPRAEARRARGLLDVGREVRHLLHLADLDDVAVPAGQRDAHWTASAFDFTWISQYPPITSLASAKGPSVTLGFPRENETRVPIEGGWSPSSASSTPAFVSASLNFVISATISALGMAPGSAFS